MRKSVSLSGVARQYIGGRISSQNTLEVSKGAGRKFTVELTDADGTPMDWDGDVTLVIDKPATVITVDYVDNLAHPRIEEEVCDQVKSGAAWRLLWLRDGETIPICVLVGDFQRVDGGATR